MAAVACAQAAEIKQAVGSSCSEGFVANETEIFAKTFGSAERQRRFFNSLSSDSGRPQRRQRVIDVVNHAAASAATAAVFLHAPRLIGFHPRGKFRDSMTAYSCYSARIGILLISQDSYPRLGRFLFDRNLSCRKDLLNHFEQPALCRTAKYRDPGPSARHSSPILYSGQRQSDVPDRWHKAERKVAMMLVKRCALRLQVRRSFLRQGSGGPRAAR